MTILVADDDEQSRSLLAALLAGNGYQVVIADNGADALALARKSPPDLIVSDVLMPAMDGYALCREWRKDERLQAIPFVFYTATYTDERDRVFALGLGAQRFLIRPQEPDSLLQTIRETLAARPRPSSETAAPTPGAAEAEEASDLRQYNGLLVRKLEHKVQQLEQSNRALAQTIAEHGRAEESLRESEARFRPLYENSPDAILLTGPDGSVLAANPACCRMFGLSEDAICRLGPAGLVDATDPRLAPLLEERARTGKAHGELTFVRGDRTRFPGEVTSSLFTDGHDRAVTCMVICEVTMRRQAEDALRERDLRLDKLASQAPGMLYQFMRRPDGTYCVPFTSVAIRNVFGCSPEQVREDFSPIARVILPEDLGRVIGSIEASASELTPWQCEYRVQVPGGAIRWLWGRATPERLPDGSILWHGFNADVTERKEAEAAIQEQLDELRRWQQATEGREGRILELKKEVNELLVKAGQAPRYASAVDEE